MVKTSAFRAVSLLWLGSVMGSACMFLAQVILARELGKSSFGLFASALTTVNLLIPLAGFGVAPFWLKVFGEEGWNAQRWWPGSFRFVIVSTFCVIITLGLWAIFGPHQKNYKIVLSILILYVVGQVVLELVSSKLQLEENYFYLAAWQFAPQLARLSLVMLLSWSFIEVLSIYHVSLIYSLVSIIVFVVGGWFLLKMQRGGLSLKGHETSVSCRTNTAEPPSGLKVAAEAWPFGAAGLFYLLYFQSAIILLSYLVSSSASGIYNTAFIIVSAIYIFPYVVYQKFLLPKIHRWANSDKNMLAKTFNQGNWFMFLFGLIAMFAVWLSSWWFVPLLFGIEYNESVIVLNILALAIPIRFVATSAGSVLATKNNMKKKVRYMGVVALFNISISLIAIPLYGVDGAAVTVVLSDALLLIIYLWAAKRYVFKLEQQ